MQFLVVPYCRMRDLYLQYIIRATWVIIILLVASTDSFAQTCSVSMGNLAFGSINTLAGTAVDTSATMTITCSGGPGGGHATCISIGAGAASGGTRLRMRRG